MAGKKGYRGTIGRILVHGGSLEAALGAVAEDWIEGVNDAMAKKNYAEGLGDYLKFYIPAIEEEYLNRLNNTPDYFGAANRFTREQTALAIMEKTHELAAEWKYEKAKKVAEAKKKALGGSGSGFASQYGRRGAAGSKETPKIVNSLTM
jgi:hypothetical protein